MVFSDDIIALTLADLIGCFIFVVICYYLKQMLQDLRAIRQDQTELHELFIWLKAQQGGLKKYLVEYRRKLKKFRGFEANRSN